MNTKTVWIVVALLIVLSGAWYLLTAHRATAPTDTETPVSDTATTTTAAATSTAVTTPTAMPASVTTITLTDAGFAPATVTINAGDTVRFVNNSSRGMWVGSDDHPTHTKYDGTATREHCTNGVANNGTFDQCSPAQNGASWEYTFTKAGTFGYHNHVGASNTGTIMVR